jgi:hypothetical protein
MVGRDHYRRTLTQTLCRKQEGAFQRFFTGDKEPFVANRKPRGSGSARGP